MFICESCLKNNYNNFTPVRSKGKCEVCSDYDICSDIPSHSLIYKTEVHALTYIILKNMNSEYEHPDYNKYKQQGLVVKL